MKLKRISLIALLGLPSAVFGTTAGSVPTASVSSSTQSDTVSAQSKEAEPPISNDISLPTPDFEKIANPQPEDWKVGPDGAPVILIAWVDFQCPSCAEAAPLLKELADAYPQDVQIVFRHFPLPSHDKSRVTAEATEAAGAQGKFWELEALLFEGQAGWTGESVDEVRTSLSRYAQQLGLDVPRFNSDLDAGKYTPRVQGARELAEQLDLPGTPFLVINQQPWPHDTLALAYSNLEGMVKFFVDLPRKQFKEAPAMSIDRSRIYTATLKTDGGDIRIRLLVDKAPVAVNNFVFLARAGWYDKVPFHRVLEGIMAQAGDPSGTGYGRPGYTFNNEVTGIRFDREGLVAMANAGVDENGKGTNGCQFFITLGPAPQIDAADPARDTKCTVFGEVVAGMDVVRQITIRSPERTPEIPSTLINTVTIEEEDPPW